MHPHLDRALAPVLRDLRATAGPVPILEDSAWQDSVEGAESGLLRSRDGSGMGVWVDVLAPGAEQISSVGDQVQEWVFEELAAMGRPTNWPPCPHHPHNHPLTARVEDGVAVWSCPASETVVARVGHLTAGSA